MIIATSTARPALRIGKPCSTVQIAFAWTSGPDMPVPVAVAWMSWRDGAVAPITTTLSWKVDAGTWPRRTRENDTEGIEPGGPAKSIHAFDPCSADGLTFRP